MTNVIGIRLLAGWSRVFSLLFLLVLNLSFPRAAHADIEWLKTLNLNTPYTYGADNLPIRRGDEVFLDLELQQPPPGGPETTLIVNTASGHEYSTQGKLVVNYSAPNDGESIRAVMQYWDANDYAIVRIGISQRTNLTALPPVVQGDGSFRFGYRSSRPWNPGVQRVLLKLYYTDGTRPVQWIAETTLDTQGTNVEHWVNVPANQIPVPSNGITGLLAKIDEDGAIPETDEGDNQATALLADLSVEAPKYDSNGNITYRYRVSNAADAVTQFSVPVKLYYATGPTNNDIIGDPIHVSGFDVRRGSSEQFRLKVGEYRLPPYNANYLVAVIDKENQIREAVETNNSASARIQVARNYERIYVAPGITVCRLKRSARPTYMTVVELQNGGAIRHFAPTYRPLKDHITVAQSEGGAQGLSLHALVNGTYFEPDWFSPGTLRFFMGLKRTGSVLDEGDPARLQMAKFNPAYFAFDGTTAGLINYPSTAFDDARYPELIGVIRGRRVAPSGDRLRRTWLGLRDAQGKGPLNETRYATVLIFSAAPTSYANAMKEMKAFGITNPTSTAALDGGGSTTLVIPPNQRLFEPVVKLRVQRRLPHVLGLYSRQ